MYKPFLLSSTCVHCSTRVQVAEEVPFQFTSATFNGSAENDTEITQMKEMGGRRESHNAFQQWQKWQECVVVSRVLCRRAKKPGRSLAQLNGKTREDNCCFYLKKIKKRYFFPLWQGFQWPKLMVLQNSRGIASESTKICFPSDIGSMSLADTIERSPLFRKVPSQGKAGDDRS